MANNVFPPANKLMPPATDGIHDSSDYANPNSNSLDNSTTLTDTMAPSKSVDTDTIINNIALPASGGIENSTTSTELSALPTSSSINGFATPADALGLPKGADLDNSATSTDTIPTTQNIMLDLDQVRAPSDAPFPFLKLSPELRNRIYEYAFSPEEKHGLAPHALTRANRQIRAESLGIYYEQVDEIEVPFLSLKHEYEFKEWVTTDLKRYSMLPHLTFIWEKIPDNFTSINNNFGRTTVCWKNLAATRPGCKLGYRFSRSLSWEDGVVHYLSHLALPVVVGSTRTEDRTVYPLLVAKTQGDITCCGTLRGGKRRCEFSID